ncbi:hypothetical protein AGLY_011145 [Aphis glycines]|uniref:Reverse transcriptase domain-containing protein n=1 Tax=Aphis glycines TaxID=307491 RepID=A0A6G0TCL4_APHGL|nr:hypothetical protein AGLY_011145 [Aphis glycines]
MEKIHKYHKQQYTPEIHITDAIGTISDPEEVAQKIGSYFQDNFSDKIYKQQFINEIKTKAENIPLTFDINPLVSNSLSTPFSQQNGIPQGSSLAVTIFLLAINDIVETIRTPITANLFADDFNILIRSQNTKTLKKNNRIIPTKNQIKILGMIFVSKLSWLPHLKITKTSLIQKLNIIKIISHTSWGGDTSSLLKIYRALIRSKAEYGSTIFGTANKKYLKMFDTPINLYYTYMVFDEIINKKKSASGYRFAVHWGWGGPRTRLFEAKLMKNLVLNFLTLDINTNNFMNFELQNNLQIFIILTNFCQNLNFKC